MNFKDKLEELERDFEETEAKMADPAFHSDMKGLQSLAKRHSKLSPVVAKFREFKKVSADLLEARSLMHCGDHELETLAKEECSSKEERLQQVEEEMKVLLLPEDPNDEKSVMVEIRAGAGGEEAALFASVLFRMYTRFAEREGWRTESIDFNETGIGGYKEIVFRIDGDGAYSKLKFESGVHRVQRVPVTEAGGRIHTSTATVAVLPEAEEVDVEIKSEDLKIDTYR
ncbi:MAG: PCRF domain-containing protein, partial [Aminobacteriaceae bacterium]